MILLVLFTLLLSSKIFAWPSAVPLAVRSPYLNCWLHSNSSGEVWSATLNLSQTLGWSVLVRVDNLTYSFLGDKKFPYFYNGTANITNIATTPTQTVIAARAGPMQVNLTFINPIESKDWVKQSIPFSYMHFSANSLDDASHAVQVYSGVSGEWLSADRSQKIMWNTTYNSDVIFHYAKLYEQEECVEFHDQAQWGTLYYATKVGNNVTYQIALDVYTEYNFMHSGMLNNQQDPTAVLPISDSVIFAMSRDLGTIRVTQNSAVWAIGYTTDRAINHTDLSGAPPTSRLPYYKTQYSNDGNLIVDFLNDFNNTSSATVQSEDNTRYSDFQTITKDFPVMATIALAEVYGSMQLTVGTDEDGNPNKYDVMMFMKNIGGVNKNRVNAVETLYAAFPALMYIDPSLGAPLLEALFRLQTSRNYTVGYAAADLGSKYPSVSGNNTKHSQGVEQTGNMLIMTYAYARASGDGSLISKYYPLLSSWADYLNASTLFITNQSSADNLAVDNQTNLAIKGIIAIQAMSNMSSVVGRTDDVNKYYNAAANLYTQWKKYALSSDKHLLAVYGQTNSWTLGYNLFADVWLGTGVVESSVYTGHSKFIDNLTSSFLFGVPVDNANPMDTNIAVSSWSSFVAAMFTNTNQGLRTKLIEKIYGRLFNSNSLPGVFPVYYDSVDGTSLQGEGSPAQGAVFAPLVLNASVQTTHPKKLNRGAIIGGAVAVFAVIGIVTFIQRQRRWRRSKHRSILTTDSVYSGPPMIVTPFDPNSVEANGDSGISREQQPSEIGEPEAARIELHPQSSSPPVVLSPLRHGAPVPVGLSDEKARLRTEAFRSPQPHNFQVSAASTSQSTSSLNAVTEYEAPPLNTQRLHSLVRREVERLHGEGFVGGAPPSYDEK